jgi:hypothetical protein
MNITHTSKTITKGAPQNQIPITFPIRRGGDTRTSALGL